MGKRRRIVHVITRLEPGGSSRNTVDSCAAQTRDYDVTLIHGPHNNSGGLLKLLPPEVKRVEVPELQRELNYHNDLAAYNRLKEEFARLSPDIIHTHTSKAGALGRLAAAAWNKAGGKAKTVHTPHGHLLYGYYNFLKTFVFKRAEIYLAGLTDRLIALTPGEMNESAAAGIGKLSKWRVVHSGVNFSQVTPIDRASLGVHPEDTLIGTIARLEKVKGVEYLLRAADVLKEKHMAANPKFVIIGGGELEGSLRALAGRLGVESMTIFTGWRDDAPAVAAALDIYVQPSLNEAMGRAPLEAQAAGVPAVVSRVCGLPDVIQEEKTGLSVNPGDPEDLARVLERLIIAPKLRKRLGAAAKEWALSADTHGDPRFGAAAMNRELLTVYSELLGNNEGSVG